MEFQENGMMYEYDNYLYIIYINISSLDHGARGVTFFEIRI